MCEVDDVCASRGRQKLSRCRCIAALAACLDLVPQEDLDFPWPPVAAKKVPGWKLGPVAEPVVEENYFSWTTDCSKLAQVATHLHPHMHDASVSCLACQRKLPKWCRCAVMIKHERTMGCLLHNKVAFAADEMSELPAESQ